MTMLRAAIIYAWVVLIAVAIGTVYYAVTDPALSPLARVGAVVLDAIVVTPIVVVLAQGTIARWRR